MDTNEAPISWTGPTYYKPEGFDSSDFEEGDRFILLTPEREGNMLLEVESSGIRRVIGYNVDPGDLPVFTLGSVKNKA